MKLKLLLLLIPTLALAQNPPPIPPFTNTFTARISQICFGETSNWLGTIIVTNVSTNMPWSNGDNAVINLYWACCYFCPDQHFYMEFSWTWDKQIMATNFTLHTNSYVDFGPYYIPAPQGEVDVRTQVWAPTNIDASATLQYANTLTGLHQGRWKDSGPYNGQYYYDLSPNEPAIPPYWRATNSLHDVYMQMEWIQSNHVFRTRGSHP